LNQNPILTWNANTEADLNGYRVYKKYTTSSGTIIYNSITSNTSYTDGDFLSNYKTGEDVAEYWVVAEDINNNTSSESLHKIIDGTSYIQWKIAGQETNDELFYLLKQNYPNPFNPITTINYQIKKKGFVTLRIYDMLGKEVATLVNEIKSEGSYFEKFDASNLPSGIYIYSLRANDFIQNNKMTLLK
jgi:hypothetical protein